MIKAIIFDFGNVILSFDNNIFLEKISKYTDNTAGQLHKLIYLSGLERKYELGLITSDEFFKATVKKCSLSISKSDFIDAYISIFKPIQTTIDLIKKLRNYKLALLSDTNELHFKYIIKQTKIFNLFDEVVVSFKVNLMKPDIRIFKKILDKLDLSADECVYIDDIKEYADAAKRIGMHGIHYTSYEKLVALLNELGICI